MKEGKDMLKPLTTFVNIRSLEESRNVAYSNYLVILLEPSVIKLSNNNHVLCKCVQLM